MRRRAHSGPGHYTVPPLLTPSVDGVVVHDNVYFSRVPRPVETDFLDYWRVCETHGVLRSHICFVPRVGNSSGLDSDTHEGIGSSGYVKVSFKIYDVVVHAGRGCIMDSISIFVRFGHIAGTRRSIESTTDVAACSYLYLNTAIEIKEVVDCIVVVAYCGDCT